MSFFIVAVTACRTSRTPVSSTGAGFSEDSYEKILTRIEENKVLGNSINLESEWLTKRLEIVKAKKYAQMCLDTELRLAADMSKFGSFDQRLPSGGFINDEERVRWEAQLKAKKSSRILAEARVNLLRRDLNEIEEKIIEKGYRVPIGWAYE